jgi:hydrophobic/amphiphilic exporter-1 (mainly G- bacteria), HAE1 family
MNGLIRFCTGRPVFASMAGLIVLLIGGFSLLRLPQDLLPDIELPVVSVSTSYPNAGPEEIEQLLTRPLEQVLAGVPGIEEMTSLSSEGSSSITIQFAWGTDLNAAANDVRDRIDRILNQLPDEATRPQLRKFDPNQRAIVVLGVASDMYPTLLRRLLEQQVLPRMEQLPGVAIVEIRGGLEREVRVELDSERLEALNLSVESVLRAIREANTLLPAGDLREGGREIMLRTPALLDNTEALARVIVERRGNAQIALADVATVLDTHRDITRIIRINGEPGVRLAVRKQSGYNTVEVAQAIAREVERINRDFPQLSVSIMEDRSRFIQASLRNVGMAIGFGSFLAITVLVFFLRSARSVFAISVAIPLSLVGTFILLYFQGMTLNLFTLGGLALGVGMMVDNAIVVIENIYRKRAAGERLRASAIAGASEVAPAILASTLTTLAIFLPLLFLSGVAGVLFRQLAFVVAFALLCSLLTALTIVPMMAGNLPERQRAGQSPRRWSQIAQALQEQIFAAYDRILVATLNRRITVIIAITGLSLASFWIIPRLGSEFFPEADEGQVQVTAEIDQGLGLEVMSGIMRVLEQNVVELVPEIESMDVDIGATAWRPGAGSTGRIRINLVSLRDRHRSSEAIAAVLQDALEVVPGVRIRARASGGAFNFSRLGFGGEDGERLTLEISGFDLAILDAVAAQALPLIREVDGVIGVRVARERGVPRLAVRIDRERAADLGLSAEQIGRTLQTIVGGTRAGALRLGDGDEVDIRVRLAGVREFSREAILNLQIIASDGRSIALRNVIELETETGATQIHRRNQQRINTLSIDVAGRDIGSIANDIREVLDTLPRPDNVQVLIRGDYEEKQRAFRDLMFSLGLALLLVYMVLACLYESLRDPLIVMFSVPLAASGALLALWLTGTTLSVQSFIGFIMLVGIVVNNAILIVDQANSYMQSGLTAKAAAREAGRVRLRPILMTMLTTVLALLPLALGYGEGGEAQASLARVVVGGLISSSLITLIVIPAVFSFRRSTHHQKSIS